MAERTKGIPVPAAAAVTNGVEAARGLRERPGTLTLRRWLLAALLPLALGCGETQPGREGPDGALTRIDIPPADVSSNLPVRTAADSPGDGVVLAPPDPEDAKPKPAADAVASPRPPLGGAWFEVEPGHGTLVSARVSAARSAVQPSGRSAEPETPASGAAGTQPRGTALEFLFDKESEAVNPAHYGAVERLAQRLQEQPGATVLLEGHTDNRGSAEYNQRLSLLRAKAVANFLTERHGVEASRVRAVGLGEERPLAGNDTAEGRAQNRCVVAVFSGQ